MSTKRSRFRIGHMYTIDYDDHYSSDKVYRDDLDNEPCVLRAHGVVLKQTKKLVVLEHQVTLSDKHPTNKRIDVHGILKSAIVRVQEFGPAKR